jgi:hypothetical protein
VRVRLAQIQEGALFFELPYSLIQASQQPLVVQKPLALRAIKPVKTD